MVSKLLFFTICVNVKQNILIHFCAQGEQLKKLKSFIGQKIIFENENKDRFVKETRQVRKLVSWIVGGGFLLYILNGHFCGLAHG